MKRIMIACAFLGMSSLSQAALDDYLPEAKLAEHTASLKKGYVGLGMTNRLVHGNAELVTPYGIAYGKIGVYTNGEDVGIQAGFRMPYHFTGTDQNGYYFGVYGGHTENAKIDNEQKRRLGAGVDLSYVKLNAQRLSTISVGIGASEKLEGRYGSETELEPEIQFAYTLSFGLF